MKHSPLTEFDSITAAGILARAALSITDQENPSAEEKIHNEFNIRRQLFVDARNTLGVAFDDNSTDTLERIGDVLDAESDLLIEEVDQDTVLNNLSQKGMLPSDLFNVAIVTNIENFHGKKFKHEKELIELTVKSPDQEQHYGEPVGPSEPFLISLFSKYFPNHYPLRSFTLLVAGQRNGLVLVVHQAWRVYADLVNLDGVSDLVGMLERFSDSFGAEIEIGSQKGHFIKSAELKRGDPFPPTVKIPIRRGLLGKKIKSTETTITCFYQQSPTDENNKAALIVAIDLDRYREALQIRGW